MKVGISTASLFGKYKTEDCMKVFSDIGCSSAEVFLSTYCEYTADFAKILLRNIDKYNIDVYSVHALTTQFEPQLFSKYNRSKQDALNIYKQILRTARSLGAKVYVFHGGALMKPAMKQNLNMPHILDTVRMLSDIAQEYGIKFTYENVHWCWFNHPEFAYEIKENTDNTYFTMDIKQAAQSGYDPCLYIKAMGQRLINLHICDYKRDAHTIDPVLPFTGDADFNSIKKALGDIGYNERATLEVYNQNYKNIKELRQSFKKVTDFFA